MMASAGSSSSSQGESFSPESYYYGADSVVNVQLDMEARLDCVWERPLMPKEMLARLPSGALRPEDNTVLNAQDGAAAPAGPATGM